MVLVLQNKRKKKIKAHISLPCLQALGAYVAGTVTPQLVPSLERQTWAALAKVKTTPIPILDISYPNIKSQCCLCLSPQRGHKLRGHCTSSIGPQGLQTWQTYVHCYFFSFFYFAIL